MTAYEMRISVWSSDVYSSDLDRQSIFRFPAPQGHRKRLSPGLFSGTPPMNRLLAKAKVLLPEFLGRLTARRDSGPLDSVAALRRFVSTRAAFMAQKTLYGYLKTRMGTRYPRLFEDDVLIASVDLAKLHIYAACLADPRSEKRRVGNKEGH